jgi:hypothetical protein
VAAASNRANTHDMNVRIPGLKRWIPTVLIGAFIANQAAPAAERVSEAMPGAPLRTAKFSFADLGAESMTLRGVQSSATVSIGIREDEEVVAAVVHLRFSYSPSMLQELSHLRVSLNGQGISSLLLSKADAGREIERDIVLDPRYFSDYNQLKLDLIGHYSLECEDPQHSSLWTTIGGQSAITLTLRRLDLKDDLALLPAPFFDRRDSRRLILPIVLPTGASREIVRSAGAAASWFGMLAEYRGARFPVSFDSLPEEHALVFATNASRPASLNLPDVQIPTVSVVDHPSLPWVKLLVLQGKDEIQLRESVEGLILGREVLGGNIASISKVGFSRRILNDAPRWLRTDRPVKFGELVEASAQLQAHGVNPVPLSVSWRLPPDLFTWNRPGVPIELHYRYTPAPERDNSMLTVSINGQLLRSYRLSAESDNGRSLGALLQQDASRESRDLVVPAFQLAIENQLQFQFAMDVRREALCKQAFTDNVREAIDPDSTIDLSAFPHYAALPDLALFANAGFPFTRFADLGETAVVLHDLSDRAALEQLFFLLGRMGRQTGAAALSYRLIDAQEARTARDVDLLLLSETSSNELLSQWGRGLTLLLDKSGREYRRHESAQSSMNAPRRDPENSAAPSLSVQAGGSLGAYMSFESQVTGGRTVVALVGSDSAAANSLLKALEDPSKVSLIRGDLAILHGEEVISSQGRAQYYLGSLPWWQWVGFHLSRHALLLTLLALVAACAAGLLIYGRLQGVAARRLQGH